MHSALFVRWGEQNQPMPFFNSDFAGLAPVTGYN